MKEYYFTSESVTEGHPDKMCDYISDNILDECLKQDRNSRVAVETFATADLIIVGGQITTKAKINIEKIVRDTIKNIGFNNSKYDIDYKTCEVRVKITNQSPDIAKGVNSGGAGDQGIMFGYACNETPTYMPYAIYMSNKLAERLAQVRKCQEIEYLRPDGKTQVTVEYENNKPKRIESIVISTQHKDNIEINELRRDVLEKVVLKVIPNQMIDKNSKIYINPNGNFIIGGPLGDTGLTGRKIMADTYGGYARHGGGAFSGKDATKIDRSGCYMMRYIAKNIVANGYADKCEIQIAYVIGKEKPISMYINTFETGNISEEKIFELITNRFDLTPLGIIEYLNLKNPIYAKTTNYGHFGKNDLPWEKIIFL